MNRTDEPLFHADFKLSITKALADQLAEKLAALRPHPFSKDAIQSLQRRPGVYLLLYEGCEVYVGKAQNSLQNRLLKHWDKLSGRKNLSIGDMSFVCLYVDEDLDAAAPEKLLIKKYRSQERDRVLWNTNGFGNNDPGRHRDKSEVKANHFDAIYPVRLDLEGLRFSGVVMSIGYLLDEMKAQLPYLFRFDKKSRRANDDYKIRIEVPVQAMSLENVIKLFIRSLPEGWQATALPGYLILYPEHLEYPSALRLWRREGNEARGRDHDVRLAPSEEIREVDSESESRDEDGE